MNADFRSVITASKEERTDLFLRTARRIGTAIQYVEKDFWVCWTLDALYHGLPAGGPRLLFKGGTSLSKALGLIQRFSEDIDITVFRDDIGQPASAEELASLSGKKREKRLDAIRDACHEFVCGPLRASLSDLLAAALADRGEQGSVDIDDTDAEGQTLLIRYPTDVAAEDDYVRPVVRIECGAKSALDPNRAMTITPFAAGDLADRNLSIPDVTTIEPVRTFWDKIVIVHGARRWYEIRGEMRQAGQRVSRHYYDLHLLRSSAVGPLAVRDRALGADCVRHAQLFFNRSDFGLASAAAGRFAIAPPEGMREALRRDYENMASMIFGPVPPFEDVLESMDAIEQTINAVPSDE